MIRLSNSNGSSSQVYVIPQFYAAPGSNWGQQHTQLVNHNLNSTNLEVKILVSGDANSWQDPGNYYYADGPLRIKGWWADFTNLNSMNLQLYRAATWDAFYAKGTVTKFA